MFQLRMRTEEPYQNLILNERRVFVGQTADQLVWLQMLLRRRFLISRELIKNFSGYSLNLDFLLFQTILGHQRMEKLEHQEKENG
ncbi:unnamed protein product [Paramecium octaurelia]|uniref:Uncharacterized protein n=1 Tax=Paramecium octaurelia TaxID=43137 RepID=A0A8S1TV55_PAROT|nr:unnamed protein product [Paramecium octaurelia]